MIRLLAVLLLSTVPAAPATPVIGPLGVPPPRPGLWNIEGVLSTGKGMSGRMCVGKDLPDAWKVAALQATAPGCRISRRREGDKGVIDAICTLQIGKQTSASRLHMTGDERSMNMTIDIDANPALGLDKPGHLQATYSYAGECPSTLKEGQMQQADGSIINLSGGARP